MHRSSCPRRVSSGSSSLLREAPVGRLRYWDEGRVVSGYDGVWASRYRKEHGQAWHEIYVGNHGFMPDKREWPGVARPC